MNNKKTIRKERVLAYSWLAAYTVFGLIINAVARNNVMNGEPPFQLATPFNTIIICVLMFVFYPWLHFVRIYSKAAKWKPAVIISTFLQCLFTIWLIISVVLTVLAFFDVVGPTAFMI